MIEVKNLVFRRKSPGRSWHEEARSVCCMCVLFCLFCMLYLHNLCAWDGARSCSIPAWF